VLRNRLDNLGLSSRGTKPELIKRLADYLESPLKSKDDEDFGDAIIATQIDLAEERIMRDTAQEKLSAIANKPSLIHQDVRSSR
jgi:hypothetical protein